MESFQAAQCTRRRTSTEPNPADSPHAGMSSAGALMQRHKEAETREPEEQELKRRELERRSLLR